MDYIIIISPFLCISRFSFISKCKCFGFIDIYFNIPFSTIYKQTAVSSAYMKGNSEIWCIYNGFTKAIN